MSFILNMMGLDEDYSDIFNDCVAIYDEAANLIGMDSDISTPEGNTNTQNPNIKSPQKEWLNVNYKNKNKNKNINKNKNTKTIDEELISSYASPQMFSAFANRSPAPANLTLEVATGITEALSKSSLDKAETIKEVQQVLDTFMTNIVKNNVGTKTSAPGLLGSVLGKTDSAASDFISSSKEDIKSLMTNLNSKFNLIGDSTKSTVILVLLLAVLVVALRDNKKMLFILTIPLLLSLLGVEKLVPLIQQIKERISSLALVVHDLTSLQEAETTENVEPQGPRDFAFLSALPSLVFGHQAAVNIIGNNGSFPTFIMRNYSTSKQGISDLMTLLTSSIKFFLEKTGYGGFYDNIASKLLSEDNTFNDYTKEIFDIEMLMSQKKFNFTVDNYNILIEKLVQGEKLLATINVHKHGNGIFAVMSSTVARVRAFKKIFDDSGFMVTGLRQEPASILFRGAPGMFKTQAMQHLCHAVISAVIDDNERAAYKANPELYIYNRLIESEYWDAYTVKCIITIFDDLFQVKDVPGSSSNEAMEVIRAINENTFVLHMAELSAKGNTHFNSKFVFATTNSPSLDSNSIVDKGALLRRFDHVYTVEPMEGHAQPGFSTGTTAKFDKTTLPLGVLGVTSTRPDNIIHFRRFNLITQTSSSDILNFAQVVSEILETYEMKKLYFEQKLLELADRRDEYTPVFGEIARYVKERQETTPSPQIGISTLSYAVTKVKSTISHFTEDPAHSDLRMKILEMMDVDTAMKAPIQTSYLSVKKENLRVDQAAKWIFDICEDEDFDTYGNHLENMNPIQLEEHLRVLYYILNHASALNKHMLHQTLFKIMVSKFGQSQMMGLKFHNLLPHNKYQIADMVTYDYVSHTDISQYTHSTVEMVTRHYATVQIKFGKIKNAILSSSIYKFYKKYSTYVNIAILLPTLFFGVRAMYKYFTGEEIEADFQSGNGSKQRSKTAKKTLKKVTRRNFSKANPQVSLSDDTQCRDILLKVIKGNSYEIFLSSSRDEEFDKCGQIVFIHGNVCMMPHHFVDLFNDVLEQGHTEARIKLVSLYSKSIDSSSTEMYLRDFIGYTDTGCSNVLDSDNLVAQDLTLVRVKNMTHRPSLMRFISPSSYVQGLRHKLTCMIAKNSNVAEIISVPTNIVQEVVVASMEYEQYTIPKSFIYNVATKKGDCGAIVAIADTANSVAKICGMHVAGTPRLGRGYAAIFCREDIIAGFEENGFKDLLTENQAVHDVAEKQCDDPLFSKFRIVESDLPNLPIPAISKIIPSPMHGVVTTPFMKPSKLSRPSDEPVETNPWFNAYASYNMSTSMGDAEMIKSAAENYSDMLFHNSEIIANPKVYTFEQAITGIEGTSFSAMSRGSSPGYPDITDPRIKTTGRKYYFGNADEYDLTGTNATKLKDEINTTITSLLSGQRVKFVYVDYLKDELRDIAKVDMCKTRLFSASPLRLLILYRMYFGEYTTWVMDNRINNQSATGVNVYSAETEVIVQKLCQFAVTGIPTVGAGDFKGFDGSENKSIHQESLSIIQRFYKGSDDDTKIREILWNELTNSIHYFNGNLLEWTASLPSGHPMTTIVNNMYNGIAFRYCWERAFQDTPLQYTFNENAWLITQGDDNVFCVRSDLTNSFNEAVVSKYMHELGLNYTKEDKTTADSTLRNVHQVEFLKRKWVYNTKVRRHVAPLRLNRLLETLSWTKESPYKHQIPRDNVDTILHELSLHGEAIFNNWSPKIIAASVKCIDYHPKNTSYTALVRSVANMELVI